MRRFTLHPSSFILPALAALALLFYRQAAFTNLIFARGDTLLYFYPYWDYRAQSLLAGHLPLWNSYLFMGVPFLANSQAGVFYPLNWPLIFFPAPVAVKISIIAHVIIAAWGTYALARCAFDLEPMPAAFAAAVFAFGGYLTAQVEHVNQLQGLAWLPFALLSTIRLTQLPNHPTTQPPNHPTTQPPNHPTPQPPNHPATIVHCSLLSLFIALQLTAGHTQTAFITLVACALTALIALLSSLHPPPSTLHAPRSTLFKFGFWTFGVILAFALSAVQLIPTLELSRLSLRGGGLPLNEAVSFSLNPLLLGRALLPGYSRVIFSEFIAHIGILPLLLATFPIQSAIVNRYSLIANRQLLFAISLSTLGLLFAFGGYNPLYLLLAKLPGFSFFRVPARWLVLWSLGSALLAGVGLQRISDQPSAISHRQFASLSLPLILLISLSFLSASITPPGELGPLGLPSPLDLALWLTPLVTMFIASRLTSRASRPTLHAPRSTPHASCFSFFIFGFGILELFIASSPLPPNHLTTPDTYSSIRPAMTQLLAAPRPTLYAPRDRFLSLSQLEFDPGDLAELRREWDSQLPPDAVYDAIIAAKHKEVLSPNLPLTWRIPSVDGYDGGILPLRAYAEFAKQFGDVPPNTDGRLRQFLRTVPANDLLSLTNTRWIITDKTGDAWLDNVFYDLGLTATVTSPSPLTLARIPNFQATALGLVLDDLSQSGVAQITLDTGETVTAPITFDPSQPAIRLRWSGPAAVEQIVILTPTALVIRGASLIDERTDTFHSLTLGPYRLAHSGDVKVYENLNTLPRAFVVSSLAEPLSPFILPPSSFILKYETEHVLIQTSSDTPGYLILTDTNYPGWLAAVDDQPAPIETAYGLFRAVALPAGTHTVEFRFDPFSLKLGAMISALSLLTTLVFLFGASDQHPQPNGNSVRRT